MCRHMAIHNEGSYGAAVNIDNREWALVSRRRYNAKVGQTNFDCNTIMVFDDNLPREMDVLWLHQLFNSPSISDGDFLSHVFLAFPPICFSLGFYFK